MGEILSFRASDTLTDAELSLVKVWACRHESRGVGYWERDVDDRGNVSISILDWDGFEIFHIRRQGGICIADCRITFFTLARGVSLRNVLAALESRFTPLARPEELEACAIGQV